MSKHMLLKHRAGATKSSTQKRDLAWKKITPSIAQRSIKHVCVLKIIAKTQENIS